MRKNELPDFIPDKSNFQRSYFLGVAPSIKALVIIIIRLNGS